MLYAILSARLPSAKGMKLAAAHIFFNTSKTLEALKSNGFLNPSAVIQPSVKNPLLHIHLLLNVSLFKFIDCFPVLCITIDRKEQHVKKKNNKNGRISPAKHQDGHRESTPLLYMWDHLGAHPRLTDLYHSEDNFTIPNISWF